MSQTHISSFFKRKPGAGDAASPAASAPVPVAPPAKRQKIDVSAAATQPDLDTRRRFLDKLVTTDARPQLQHDASTATAGAAAGGEELTPLEKQIQAIQAANPDTMLVVEVGYKFRFFGSHARIAAGILGIACFKSHAFLTASVPVHRLDVHVNRLVQAGWKVGVVRQTETAALKAAGDNKSKAFDRQLTEVVTKGTYLGEQDAGWILSVHERDKGPTIAIVAVRIETGEILYDEFEDDVLRQELERRLIAIEVAEVVVAGAVTPLTEKVLRRNDRRVEVRERDEDPRRTVAELYERRLEGMTESILVCFAALIAYLRDFKLDSILKLHDFFTPFRERLTMQLPATTLLALEVFHNTSTGEEYGSLFWVLNHTSTAAGKRLLRRWIANPSIDVDQIRERQRSVQAFVEARGSSTLQKEKLERLLRRLSDVEKGLNKIFHERATRPDCLQTLLAFQAVSQLFDARESFSFMEGSTLNEDFATLGSCPVDDLLGELHIQSMVDDDKYNAFKESASLDAVSDHKMGILMIESDLREHLEELKAQLSIKSLEYVTVAGVEYLIELPNAKAKTVAKDWLKVSGTKAVSRFHTPRALALIQERAQRKELLAIECDKAYAGFLGRIGERYDRLRCVSNTLAKLDCLLSLAAVSARDDFCRPEFLDDQEGVVDFVQCRHPIIEKLIRDPFVPNDVSLRAPAAMILTGPNMGGKSSAIRQIALCVLMAQLGCYVPAQQARLAVVDGIYCRMGALDNWAAGQSTFMVELVETADLMQRATQRSLVVVDELGRGTATIDGSAIAAAVLHHLVRSTKCMVLFVTHYRDLATAAPAAFAPGVVANWHVAHREDGARVTFLYHLRKGVSDRSFGLNVARMAGVPEGVVVRAAEVAAELEHRGKRGSSTAQNGVAEAMAKLLAGQQWDDLADQMCQRLDD